MISIQLPAELLTVAMFLIVATVFSIVLSRAQLNVLNCRVAEVPQGDRMYQNQLFF